MKLRSRILLYFSAMIGVALALVAFWCWFEFNEQLDRMKDEGVGAALKHSALQETLEILLFGGVPAIILGIVSGALLIARALRPIEKLTEVLEQTDVSNLSEPVARSGNGDELDRMAAVFNRMKERLGASFTQTREFTLHASHELKTPLTIMHSTLEQMLGDAQVPGAHRERIGSLLEEVQRLSGIVGQLTFLAKADAGLLPSVREEVALDELMREVVEDALILGAGAGIKVQMDACEPVVVHGDRMRLRQLLLIIADNAVKHNHQDGSVQFSLRKKESNACIEVINTGKVPPPEVRARVFERFFRGDATAANGMAVEGSGLGLSIAASIVESKRGAISMDETPDGRTCLTVSLPLAASDK